MKNTGPKNVAQINMTCGHVCIYVQAVYQTAISTDAGSLVYVVLEVRRRYPHISSGVNAKRCHMAASIVQ